MARDDRFKKVTEAGADFLETARARAEDFLKELSRAGGGTQGSLNDLLKESRKGTEQLVATIRSEIRSQLSALGLATKSDLAGLERKVAPAKTSARKTTARKTTARKTTARKATAAKSAASGTAAKTTSRARKAPSAASGASKAAGRRTASATGTGARKAAGAAKKTSG